MPIDGKPLISPALLAEGLPLSASADPPEWSSPRRWAVIFAFAFNALCNGFVCMDFSTGETLAKEALGIDHLSESESDEDLKWLYSSIYIVVPVVQLLVAYPLHRYNWSAMLVGVCLTVGCGWLRYVAVATRSYPLGLGSSLLAGGSAAVIVSSYSIVPEHWFAPAQRGLATAIGVQANYLGWAVGVLLPLYVDSLRTFTRFALFQAVVMSAALPVFLLGYRAPPRHAGHGGGADGGAAGDGAASSSMTHAAGAEEEGEGAAGGGGAPPGMAAAGLLLLRSPRYLAHALCCAALGGISFAITGVQDLILEGAPGCESLELPPSRTTWTNFAFVSFGVTGGERRPSKRPVSAVAALPSRLHSSSGLVVGHVVQTDAAQRRALLGLTLLSALALSGLSALASAAVFTHMRRETVYALLLVCMAAAGVGLLGFISVALRLAVGLGAPAPEVLSAGGLELLLQIFSALFAQTLGCGVQFIPCAATAWFCLFVLAFVHARPDGAGA